jgi:quercetin dioxygenase-like cupin family protein
MSFAYYTFEKGSSIHRHAHPQEEVWHIIEGELEITIDGKKAVGGPGYAGSCRRLRARGQGAQ